MKLLKRTHSFRGLRITNVLVGGSQRRHSLSIPAAAALCLSLMGGFSQVCDAQQSDCQQSEPVAQSRYPHLRVMLDDPEMQGFINGMGLRPESFTLSIPVDISGNLRRDHARGELLFRNDDRSICLDFSVYLILTGPGSAAPLAYSSMIHMSKEQVLAPGWSQEVDQSSLIKSLRSDPPNVGTRRTLSMTTIRGGGIVQRTVHLTPWQKVDYALDARTDMWTGLAFRDYTMPKPVFEAVRQMRTDFGHESQLFRQRATEIDIVGDPDRVSEMLIKSVDQSRSLSEMVGFLNVSEMRPARCRVWIDLQGWNEGAGRSGRTDLTFESPCQSIALSFRFPFNVNGRGPGEWAGHLESVYVRHPILARAMTRRLQNFAPLGSIGGEYEVGDIGRIMEDPGAGDWEFTGKFSGPVDDGGIDDGIHRVIENAIGPIFRGTEVEGMPWAVVRLVCISDGMSVFISSPDG